MLLLLLIIPLIGVILLLPISEGTQIVSNSHRTSSLYNRTNFYSSYNSILEPNQNAHSISNGEGVQKRKMKLIALITSLINLFLSILIWYQFDSNTSSYQFVYEFNKLNFCHFHIGLDGISLYFVLLTTFITPICILSNWTDINNKIKYFLISFLILETLQIAVFVVLDLFLFYVFFESVLIPLFFIIVI